jgi:hypothetical protein
MPLNCSLSRLHYRDHPLLVLMMDVFEELSLREINPLR